MDIKEQISKELPSDKELKRVEVFILHHPKSDKTEQAITSILKETKWPYRLTIIDTKDYGGVMAKIYNKLIKDSVCDYICFFCSDAVAGKDWLRIIMNDFPEDAAFVIPHIVNGFNNTNQESGLIKFNTADISTPVIIFKKTAFISTGYYNEKFFLYKHDPELYERLLKKGWNFYINTNTFVLHKGGSTIKRIFSFEELNEIDQYNKEVK